MHISFYHIAAATPAAVDAVVPPLLKKCREANYVAGIMCQSAQHSARLSDWLWSFDAADFLPHVPASSPEAVYSPIHLDVTDLTQIDVLFALNNLPPVLHDADNAPPETLKKCLFLFDEQPAHLANARKYWKKLKQTPHNMAYYAYENAAWQRKA